MFASLFDPQASFWRKIGSFTDVLVLSLLWTFCSLPLFTLGPATAALYDASAKHVRQGRAGAVRCFFTTLRRELATGALATVVWALLLAVAFGLLGLFWRAVLSDIPEAPILLAAYSVVLLLPLGALCWSFPILSRFTFGPLGLLRVSFQLSLAHLPYTVVILLLAALAALACYLFWFPLLVLPGTVALLWSLMMERVFRRYMPPEPEEEGDESHP